MTSIKKPPFQGHSPCCAGSAALEKIYEATSTGRIELGHIAVCIANKGRFGDDTCFRPFGRITRYAGTSGLTDQAWALMQRCHPGPPWYFVRKPSGKLMPENMPSTLL